MSLPWQRIINLYIDADAYGSFPLLASQTSPARWPFDRVQWVQADQFILRVWYRRKTAVVSAATQSLDLGDGWNLVVSGKIDAQLGGETLYFETDTFAEVVEGTETYYEGEINLNTTELQAVFAALPSSTTLVPMHVDIEVQDSGNTRRITHQFELDVARQIYKGTESSPTPATPLYPSPSDLVVRAPVNGSYRFISNEDGNFLQIWNPDEGVSGAWHTVTVAGVGAAAHLELGPAET
ncbi:hypothetical protein DB346_03040 [Verrucomicrobia bacterium LW23]|nr:hypothetical protein DB346_03615 [Verrucomicrobia bacterium LW23]PTY04425.1 hypothetical protein DB346_03040 [Verrucomicrobia bacterium LW23]